MEELIARYEKKVESTTHKMRIPKKAVEMFGKQFIIDIYKDKIVLKPVPKAKGE